jgi:transcriptional regulator with XRE-family HTH domain
MRKKYQELVYIGKKIKSYRQEANLTQESLAELANLDIGYISDLERGICNISVLNLIRIARALNIKPRDLFPEV